MKFVNIEDPNDVVEFLVFNYDGKGNSLVKNGEECKYRLLEEE